MFNPGSIQIFFFSSSKFIGVELESDSISSPKFWCSDKIFLQPKLNHAFYWLSQQMIVSKMSENVWKGELLAIAGRQNFIEPHAIIYKDFCQHLTSISRLVHHASGKGRYNVAVSTLYLQ